jgi:hypothetical protein
VLFSHPKKKHNSNIIPKERQHVNNKKKVNPVLRHPGANLKRIARMPSKDRMVVLKELKKQVRKRGRGSVSNGFQVIQQQDHNSSESSQASVNKDLSNWVVLHGNEEVAVEDVWGIGKAIGVKFNVDNANMFSVLSRGGSKRGREEGGEAQKGL